MSKYLHVLNIGFQNTFVYRWNFLIRCLFSFVPLMGTIYLWRVVFPEPGQEMGGYDYGRIISYFVTLILLDSIASPTEDDFQIASEIRDGLINQFLLKPVDYFVYRFCLFWSSRLIYTAVVIVPVLGVMWILREYLVLPETAVQWILSLAAVFLSACLQFLMAYCVALLAFWLLEVSAPIFIVFSIEYAFGGHLFPLDLLPAWLFEIVRFLPFYYEYFFPLQVFLGKASGAGLWQGFGLQIFWVLFFFGLGRFIWARGLRKYTAVGG